MCLGVSANAATDICACVCARAKKKIRDKTEVKFCLFGLVMDMHNTWLVAGQDNGSLLVSVTASANNLFNYGNGKLRTVRCPKQAHSVVMSRIS